MSTLKDEVIVIGAGVIGLSIALQLAANGYQVNVLERKGVAAEASGGNAGAFAFADLIPLARPGIIKQAPRWLFDPLGPLSIRLGYAHRLLPWLLRFWRASWPDRYRQSIQAQSQLMQLARAALERQIELINGAGLIQRDGQLQLLAGERAYRTSEAEWQRIADQGVRAELLHGADAIAEVQPGLNRCFDYGRYTPDWINTCDPRAWTERIAAALVAQGGRITTVDVHALTPLAQGLEVQSSAGPMRAARVVVAAGAWSHKLAQTVGESIPLETERGYNTTLPAGAFDLRTHLSFPQHGFVVTRINDGVRIGGAVELAGLALPPNFGRADQLLNKAAQFLPALKTGGGHRWMGYRPSLPDSLPVIDRSRRHRNLIYAFGHGHLGLTQAAATAELVLALVRNVPPAIDLKPYSVNRF